MRKMKEMRKGSEKEYWMQERKRILRDLLLFCASVSAILLAIGTLAWFASNREVAGDSMRVSMKDGDFELFVAGDNMGPETESGNSIYSYAEENDFVNADHLPDGEAGGYTQKMQGGQVTAEALEGYRTSPEKRRIRWRLADGQKSLAPDSQGVFTFYIVPKEDGDLNVSIKLRVDGYIADETEENGEYTVRSIEPVSTEDQQKAVQYLNGHLLFFAERQETGKEGVYQYTGLYDKDGFELEFHDVRENVPIEVSLYWIWANTFGQMVFESSDNNGRTAIAGDEETREALRAYIAGHSELFFSGMTENEIFSKMTDGSRAFDVNKVKQGTNYDDLSMGYNRADQLIGTNIDYMLLVMTAQ